MDDDNLERASQLVDPSYVSAARAARNSRVALVRSLLAQRRLPAHGVDDLTLRVLLGELAAMDSNNFAGCVGVGEREGRVYSALVRERHFGMAHGVGRAGDLAADQPKACGASLVSKLCHYLALDALRVSGFDCCRRVGLLPVATGMAMTLCLLALRAERPRATRVVWLRVDQKTCAKCVTAAGYTLDVVEGRRDGDEVVTDTTRVAERLGGGGAGNDKFDTNGTESGGERGIRDRAGDGDGDGTRRDANRGDDGGNHCDGAGTDDVLCVISTTSCFAPRAPDDLVRVAQLCRQHGVPHIVNNAYGAQSRRCCGLISAASRMGRVDIVVQSLDKNFQVPVGGALIAAADPPAQRTASSSSSSSPPSLVDRVMQMYPGRASASPLTDLFVTLLAMGRHGYTQCLRERERLMPLFKERVARVARAHGERLLDTPRNPISFAMSLQRVTNVTGIEPSHIGSVLFARRCSGARAVLASERRVIAGVEFAGYGAHTAHYACPYLAMACAVGVTERDIDVFCRRLDRALSEVEAAPCGDDAGNGVGGADESDGDDDGGGDDDDRDNAVAATCAAHGAPR